MMRQVMQFRKLLPSIQVVLAVFFGGVGLWQRNSILSHSFLGWNSTARFHVWPWPYKFAAISNMPALLVAALPSWPVGDLWPDLPETVQIAPVVPCVLLLWYWIGSRLDQRWRTAQATPWVALMIFMLVSLTGALIPIGYVGYLPFGVMLWVVTAVVLGLCRRRPDVGRVKKENGVLVEPDTQLHP